MNKGNIHFCEFEVYEKLDLVFCQICGGAPKLRGVVQ